MKKLFENKKLVKNYHVYSEHIDGFDFGLTPKYVIEEIGYDFEIIKDMAFVRDIERRKLLINESCKGYEVILETFLALDNLPVSVVRDLYNFYKTKMKTINIENAYSTSNEKELEKRLIFCMIPEILWVNGDDHVRSRLFIK